ncbi:MAG: HD domain-containing protein [Clostridia bacterium]|nr:HD domain-containing protein [Clostridia bacterium]
MKNIFVEGLVNGTEFDDFFLLKTVAVKKGSNNKEYIDMQLSDKTGDVSAKKWDASPQEIQMVNEFQDNPIVKVRASVGEWMGRKQLKITRFRLVKEEDNVDISAFIKTAPEDGQSMYDHIMKRLETVQDEDLRKVGVALMERRKEKLLYWPAASKNHHAEMGGLLYHMKRMLDMGEKACSVYTNLKKDWVIVGVVIHDMEKINEIMSDKWGISPGYSFEGQLLGHIAQGVKMIDRLAAELDIPEEKAVMLEHMILSHHYEPEFGSPKRPMFPEAELLHYLDILDARMFDMEDTLKSVEPGEFSESVRTLDGRRLYKPKFEGSGKAE